MDQFMAYCDSCGNFDDSEDRISTGDNYQPNLYYYWDSPIEEDYYWRDHFPNVDCMCEICFDIANEENKLVWV